jgi:hypothetical protein
MDYKVDVYIILHQVKQKAIVAQKTDKGFLLMY